MSKPVLGYWDLRGLGAELRYLLAYVGEDFEDKRYFIGPAPEYNRDDWLSVKFKLGLTFPNLPYYIDDKVKLTETCAILRYLGRKYKLYGDDDVTRTKVDQVIDVTTDLRMAFARLCYDKEFEQKKEAFLETASKKLDIFEDFIGDKEYFIDSKITVCDFHVYELLDILGVFDPALLETRPKLQAFCQRFRALPAIAAHLASDKFKVHPIMGPMASWK